jgi:hypothetical protein
LKKFSLIALSVLLVGTSALADGVVKKTKTEIEFKKFGSFSSVQTEMISGLKKAVESDNDFKGKGLMGKLAGKFALQSGREGRILDLPEMTVTEINHKKKRYTVQPIESFSSEDTEDPAVAGEEEPAEEEDSHIKIIRNEFTVDDTGENKTINGFDSRKFAITWIMEWENTETGEKGTTRLLTDVWTTPMAGDIQQAREIEQQFNQEHMQRIGLNIPEMEQEMLGTNWMSIFSQMGSQQTAPEQDASRFMDEMKKIKGYPVIIDGKYFNETEGGPQEEEAESEGGIGGMLGGLAKKALKKDKKEDDNQPALAYYIELIELKTNDIPENTFQPPADYKQK